MRLMIVDDNKLLRSGFRHMTNWKSKGIQIISEAINGKDALEKIKKDLPDVVLTDINMPVMNGIELTKKIKTLYPHIIVVVLSDYDDYEFVRESMKNGASDYLLKSSIDADEICDLLQKIKFTKMPNFQISNCSDQNTSNENIYIDKDIIKRHIELQNFKELKKYITSELKNIKTIQIQYLQDVIRDIFFFIHFYLDQLNLLNKHIKERKYINSSSVSLITNKETAVEWVNLIIDEIEKYCLSSTTHNKENVKKVIELINNNYKKPELTLSYIADKLYMNKNYLCDIFKAETNTTINQYIADVRINKAKLLIRQNYGTLQEIAQEVGFTDYNYFSRVFRKKMGIPPSEYQKLYR